MQADLRYSAYRARALSDDDRHRLRIAIRLQRCLSRPELSERYCSGLLPRLLRVLNGDSRPEDRNLWDWIYSYAKPDVVRKLLRNNPGWLAPGVRGDLNESANLEHLLPDEYRTPEVQIYRRCEGRKTLVCFTGNAMRMNAPVQLVHLLAVHWFDQVIYLRDPKMQRFADGIAGIADGFQALVDLIGSKTEDHAEISILSTSSGGFAAMRYAQTAQPSRAAFFSPPATFKNVPSIPAVNRLDPKRVRMYFSDASKMDREFKAAWDNTEFSKRFYMLSSDSHATLNVFLELGEIDELFAWLSGGAPDAQGSPLIRTI